MQLRDELLAPIAARLKVFADENRLRILNLLRTREISVLEIAETLGLGQPNVSRHLGVLERAGLIGRRRHGKQVFYRVVDPYLDQICEAICGSLSAHIEGQLRLVTPHRNTRRRGTPRLGKTSNE